MTRAQTPERARTEALSRRASDRMQALQREAEALAGEERTMLVELRRLEVERGLKEEALRQAEEDVQATARKLEETSRQLDVLSQRADLERPEVQSRLVQLYKGGRGGYTRLLLSVNDLRTVGRVYRMVSTLARIDRERIDEHVRTLGALQAARTALETRHAESTRVEAAAVAAQRVLQRAIADQSRLVQSIDERRDLNAQLAGELQHAQQKLQASLAGLDTRASGPAVLPLGPFRGDLEWPIAGAVTMKFGTDRNTRLGTAVIRNGIEIASDEGRPVRAIHDGTVAFADAFTGFGNLVIVDHGDQSFSLYGYLSSIVVRRGAALERRQLVGTVGRGPLGTPGLYFEVRIDGKPADPLQWLKKP